MIGIRPRECGDMVLAIPMLPVTAIGLAGMDAFASDIRKKERVTCYKWPLAQLAIAFQDTPHTHILSSPFYPTRSAGSGGGVQR